MFAYSPISIHNTNLTNHENYFTLPDVFVDMEKYSIAHNQIVGIKISNLNTSDRLLGNTRALMSLKTAVIIDG